jgi:tRNA nucleotidyltransferase (CCA-adding enzyme)
VPRKFSRLLLGDPAVARVLDSAQRLAHDGRQEVWLVGGLVRDGLVGRPSRDVDLVLLGSLGRFSARLGERLGARPSGQPGLLSIAFDTPDGVRVDVVRARAETYPARGSLPTVRPGTLREDQFRRDFTVNTMALPLAEDPAELSDPFGGQRDLERGLLRVLHDRSFEDDPLRILRALRLQSDLGLALDDRGLVLASLAVERGAFAEVSSDRSRRELERFLAGAADASLASAADLGLEQAFSPLSFGPTARERFRRIDGRLGDSQIREGLRFTARLAALAWRAPSGARAELGETLGLDARSRRLLAELPDRIEQLVRCWHLVDSEHERFLSARRLGTLGRGIAAALGSREIAEFMEVRWPALAAQELSISSEDLASAGYRPGAWIGRALAATRCARANGRIERAREEQFALAFLAAEGAPRDLAGSDPGPGDPPRGDDRGDRRGSE